jgi:NTE family protein
MHHHVALEDQIDIDSLVRFLCGRAVGFVAAGGGSFGTAHVGIYKAFRERGVMFDIFRRHQRRLRHGGRLCQKSRSRASRARHARDLRQEPKLSAADLAALFAAGSQGVRSRAGHQYGPDCRIEDCWRPFAAVATNLSTHNLELIRTGPLWQAVRASSAIPGLLPPFYTPEGRCWSMDVSSTTCPWRRCTSSRAVPIWWCISASRRRRCSTSTMRRCPGRFELIAAMLTPFRKKLLPAAPSAVNVLWRSLVAHQRYDTLPVGPFDTVMRPPSPVGIDVTDFDRHTEIFEASYLWAKEAIAALEAGGSSAIAAMLDTGALERRQATAVAASIARPAIASPRPPASAR